MKFKLLIEYFLVVLLVWRVLWLQMEHVMFTATLLYLLMFVFKCRCKRISHHTCAGHLNSLVTAKTNSIVKSP